MRAKGEQHLGKGGLYFLGRMNASATMRTAGVAEETETVLSRNKGRIFEEPKKDQDGKENQNLPIMNRHLAESLLLLFYHLPYLVTLVRTSAFLLTPCLNLPQNHDRKPG